MNKYLDALRTVAGEGAIKKPHVAILLNSAVSFVLVCNFSGMNLQQSVLWTDYMAHENPDAFLLGILDSMRENVVQAVK